MLWYWNDWGGGTRTLSRFLKGCYIDILEAQFNSGPLSLEEIKTVLGADFGQAWPTLSKKFKTTEMGLFFNVRMEAEKAKRAAYSESRRSNRKKSYKHSNSEQNEHMINDMNNISKTYVPHMENENRNRNTDCIEKGGMGEKTKKPRQKPVQQIDLVFPFQTQQFISKWELWRKYKREQHKFSYKSVITEQAALKDLSEMSCNNEEMAIKLIEHAMAKGWKGIYETNFINYGNKRTEGKQPATSDAELARIFAKRHATDYAG